MSNTPNLNALPHGTRLLREHFAIGPVLGQNDFSITYKGGDMIAKRYVAIKEFFPSGAIRRGNAVYSADANIEEFMLQQAEFLEDARLLSQISHDSVVRAYQTFEENNTVYLVMEFLEGENLAQVVKTNGPLEEKEVLRIGEQLTAALSEVHNAGLLHLNITPENVFISGKRTVLFDFGMPHLHRARKRAMAQTVTAGYSPIEQYTPHGKRGPATDIYSLAATLYYALTGLQPTNSTDRAAGISLVPLTAIRPSTTPYVESALFKAMQMEQEKRPASAADLGALLKGHIPFYNPAFMNAVKYQPEAEKQFESQEGGPSISESNNQTNVLKDHTSYVNDLSFSPTSTYLISVGQDRSVVVWNWARATLYRRLKKHEGAINTVAYSPDGTLFATGGKDQKIFVWPTGEQLQNEPQFTPCETGSDILQLAFHPAQFALTWIDEVSLKTWDLTGQNPIFDSRLNLNQFSFSPDGVSILGSHGETGLIFRLNGHTLQVEVQFATHGATVTGLAYSPNGRLVAACGTDGIIRCWNAETGLQLWEKQESHPELCCLAWSPDSKLIAIGKRDFASIWTAEGEHWRQFRRHEKFVQSVAFAPNCPAPFNYLLATASKDKTIAVHRIR